MVIDAVTWFAEEDAFQVRLTMLDELVDVFVVVEADVTHQGDAKPYRFPERFRDHPKVRWVPVELTAETPWGRENEQRRAMRDAIAEFADPDDTVVFSDCDEIWDVRLLGHAGPVIARMDFRLFSVLWQYSTDWPGSIAGVWGRVGGLDWQALRDSRWELERVVSGWHLSWMGDDEARVGKLRSFAHTEMVGFDVAGAADAGRWFDGRQMTETRDNLPDCLLDAVPDSWVRTRVPSESPGGS